MDTKQCDVCKLTQSKYRCPSCRTLYCSVGCYKSHKDSCTAVKPVKTLLENGMSTKQSLHKDLEPGELSDDESDSDEDHISTEKLAMLENSEALRDMLQNRHLRQLIKNLSELNDGGVQLGEAMKLPIFVEFANECLKVVGDEG